MRQPGRVSENAAPEIPGYDVRAPLGDGATATVWRARRLADGRAVALKVVRPAGGEIGDALREAGLLASLRHRHVVHLYDVLPLVDPCTGRPDAVVLVTQLASGGSLAQLLARRRILSPGELVTVLQPMAGALADLHELGVVHGDLSTGNIVFRGDGMPLLADLGTARVAGERRVPWGTGAGDGMVAPEVIEGFPATRESDVYQLGALAWLALVGEVPGPGFDRPPFAEVATDLPPGLVELVARCLEPQPEDRPDAEELATLLMGVATPVPVEVAPDADPAHGLTTRLRQVALEDEAAVEEEPLPWHRRWLRGRARGTGAQARRAEAPRDTKRPRARVGAHRAPTTRERVGEVRGGRSSPVAVLGVFVLAALVGSALYLLLGAPLREVMGAADGGSARASAAEASDQPVVGDAGPATAGSVTATPDAAPGPDPPVGADREDDPGRAGHADPAELQHALQALVDGRAAAWEARDPALLEEALAEGSPAAEADAAELGRARELGLEYPSVGFDVQDVEVLDGSEDRVRVSATVGRAPLEARDGDGWVLRAPEQVDRVELVLVRQGGGWRLWSWSDEVR